MQQSVRFVSRAAYIVRKLPITSPNLGLARCLTDPSNGQPAHLRRLSPRARQGVPPRRHLPFSVPRPWRRIRQIPSPTGSGRIAESETGLKRLLADCIVSSPNTLKHSAHQGSADPSIIPADRRAAAPRRSTPARYTPRPAAARRRRRLREPGRRPPRQRTVATRPATAGPGPELHSTGR